MSYSRYWQPIKTLVEMRDNQPALFEEMFPIWIIKPDQNVLRLCLNRYEMASHEPLWMLSDAWCIAKLDKKMIMNDYLNSTKDEVPN